MENEKYRIVDLADRAGVTRRTVYYYINKGLIPPAKGAGIASYYTEDHQWRIKLIKKLQEDSLPLAEIRKIVSPRTTEEVKKVWSDLEKGLVSVNGLLDKEPQKENEKSIVVILDKDDSDIDEEYTAEERSAGECAVYEKIMLNDGMELHYPLELRKRKPHVIRAVENSLCSIITKNS